MADAEIVAACDPDLSRAQAAAPKAYSTLEDLLARERLDFLDIATRPETHRDLVELAGARRVAVICQKPMAPSWEDAVAMTEAAERAGVPLMIHENWRFQPWYRTIKRILERHSVGDIVTYRFRIRKRDGHGEAPYAAQPYFRQMPRLLIHETLVHPIDTARYLFGDIDSVYASMARRNPVIVGEDVAHLTVTHKSSLPGLIDGHRFTDLAADSPPLGDAQFEGESGVIELTPEGHVQVNQSLVWENTVREGYRGDSVRATQQHFIDCLRSGSAFETGARDYLKTFATVEACYQSGTTGRRATVS